METYKSLHRHVRREAQLADDLLEELITDPATNPAEVQALVRRVASVEYDKELCTRIDAQLAAALTPGMPDVFKSLNQAERLTRLPVSGADLAAVLDQDFENSGRRLLLASAAGLTSGWRVNGLHRHLQATDAWAEGLPTDLPPHLRDWVRWGLIFTINGLDAVAPHQDAADPQTLLRHLERVSTFASALQPSPATAQQIRRKPIRNILTGLPGQSWASIAAGMNERFPRFSLVEICATVRQHAVDVLALEGSATATTFANLSKIDVGAAHRGRAGHQEVDNPNVPRFGIGL